MLEKISEKCISPEITFTLTGICPVIQLWSVGLDRTLTRVKNPFRKKLPNDIHFLKYMRLFHHFWMSKHLSSSFPCFRPLRWFSIEILKLGAVLRPGVAERKHKMWFLVWTAPYNVQSTMLTTRPANQQQTVHSPILDFIFAPNDKFQKC